MQTLSLEFRQEERGKEIIFHSGFLTVLSNLTGFVIAPREFVCANGTPLEEQACPDSYREVIVMRHKVNLQKDSRIRRNDAETNLGNF